MSEKTRPEILADTIWRKIPNLCAMIESGNGHCDGAKRLQHEIRAGLTALASQDMHQIVTASRRMLVDRPPRC